MFESPEPTQLQRLFDPILSKKGIEVFIKREDQIDTEISGNKWRKLKYNLLEAKAQGYQSILTFGGAFSNHIAATAAACKRFGFQSIGIIRGDELDSNSNPTLQKAKVDGMNLQFISRPDYQKRNQKDWLELLREEYQAFIIPEGGSNQLALKGVAEIIDEIEIDFDFIACPVGTGGTLAGLASQLSGNQTALGVSCLKGEHYLENIVQDLAGPAKPWQIFHDYHFGGYAKFDSLLIEFINHFKKVSGIQLDPVYTGKMMYSIFDQIKKGKFDSGNRIICVHTGGLQGIAGFNEQNNFILNT